MTNSDTHMPPTLITRLIKIMLIGLILGLAYVMLQSCSKPKTGLERYGKASLSKLTVLSPPPARPSATFFTPEGEETTLAQLQDGPAKGKVILVNLWATWCPPCIAEMPSLNELQAQYGDERFEVITINFDRDPKLGETFLREKALTNLPYYHNPNFALAREYAVAGLPLTIIYSPSGAERARLLGEADWTSPEAERLIEALKTE